MRGDVAQDRRKPEITQLRINTSFPTMCDDNICLSVLKRDQTHEKRVGWRLTYRPYITMNDVLGV